MSKLKFSVPTPEAPVALNDFFKAHREVEHYDWGPSLTRQDEADACDINILMAKYEKTGVLPMMSNGATFHDWTQQPDNLMDAMRIFNDAQAMFMALPAKVRRDFDNDPIAFTDFAANPDNIEEMRKYGLAPPAELPDAPRSEPADVPAAPISPAQDAPKAS